MNKLLLLFLIFIISACGVQAPNSSTNNSIGIQENTAHLRNEDLAPFYHGVASGDPYQTSVVLWTRITPKKQDSEIKVKWEIAQDSLFKKVVTDGDFITTANRDYTVKVIASELLPNTKYYYRFKGLGSFSTVGTTKTLPVGEEKIKLAVVSCSNIEFGYFNAYKAIAKEDVDAVLHLGDYIYEYGSDVYGDKSFFRKNIPDHEIITLQDYRDRYSQYRLDADLQSVHGAHPFINIWDDHEISNNAYVDGAQNHQAEEGEYKTRKKIAKMVYYEWLPIREDVPHYRKFDFGTTVDLIMLDERLAGRTQQPDSLNDPRRKSKDHHLLGKEQMDWFLSELKNSTSTWKIIGNQVIFSYSDWGYETFRHNMDAWDGYPNDQLKVSNAIKENKIQNVVFVTGDTHTAWAFEASQNPFFHYNPENGEGAVGIEFGVTSITSANANERMENSKVKSHESSLVNSKFNPHLKYVNMRDHGYLKLTLDQELAKAEFIIVPDISTSNQETKIDTMFHVKSGTTKLIGDEVFLFKK